MSRRGWICGQSGLHCGRNIRTRKPALPSKLPLTLACGNYEIVRALKEGAVEPDGIDLTILTDMDSTTRHWRFLREGHFDVAETSCSSYIVARDKGMPITAIPVFLHRRFRHGFVFINTTKGITKPTDLIGKKIGIKSFLVTAIHWMRGILEHEYGVPHKSVHWVAELDEDVDFQPPADLKITRLPHDKSVEDMLAEGEVDALIHSDIIKPMEAGDPRVARLWPDYKAEEIRFFKKTGDFPDHARARHPPGDRRPPPLGAGQPVPRLREVQGDRHEAAEQPAHRAARLVSRGLGGAGRRSSAPTRGNTGCRTATGTT